MGKQAFSRRKNTLVILVAFLAVLSMTATVVSAAGEYRDKLIQLRKNIRQGAKQICRKIKQYPLISLFFIFAVVVLVVVPS
jgi:hypothetical protein